MSLHIFIVALGLACMLLAAFNVGSPKVSLGWMGAFLIALAVLWLR